MTDWRLPENRREGFQRSYTFQLRYQNFPGMVYPMLPAIAAAFSLDADQRAWLAWLNGNTQNAVTSMLLLEAAPHPRDWKKAVDLWGSNFKALEWDADRRHQKSAFGKATESWFLDHGHEPAAEWEKVSSLGKHWEHALSQPYMGRISAWSMLEFAKILLPFIPDVGSWYLEESSSRSHRNALSLLLGHDDAWGWDRDQAELPAILGLFPALEALAEDLLAEAQERNPDVPFVTRLTMESALCTWKSHHKPDRRYPGVYGDMMYERIKKAETRMDRNLDLLWDIRRDTMPAYLRLEDNPNDPGLVPVKQNWYRETGEMIHLHRIFPDMEPSEFEQKVDAGAFGTRKDKTWK